MKPRWRVCPHCEAVLDKRTASFTKSFECPSCGEKLRVKQTGYWVRGVIVYLISASLTYECGFRGLGLIIIFLLASWPLGFAAKLFANAVTPPRLVIRPSDDPDINRCPKCGTDLGNRFERTQPFKCPQCGESLKMEITTWSWVVMVFSVSWFVGIALASLLAYESGIRGIDLALLPLAVFLVGATVLGLLFRLVGKQVQRIRVEVVPPDAPSSTIGRTELKL
jgi:predicted RNA-binding Zn-ribbon protein involved in translation (DUF1610 family)